MILGKGCGERSASRSGLSQLESIRSESDALEYRPREAPVYRVPLRLILVGTRSSNGRGQTSRTISARLRRDVSPGVSAPWPIGTMATGRNLVSPQTARTADSSNAPTHAVERPSLVAARTAKVAAIVASWTAYKDAPRLPYVAAERSGSAKNTKSSGACARKSWPPAATARARRLAADRTTKIRYACRLPAEGARETRRRIRSRAAGSTSSAE
jgi:hypothetical protein